MRIVIDGTTVESEQDIHDQLKRQLDFGPYYGDNLSALWDRLYRDIPGPLELVWENSETSKEKLGEDLYRRASGVFSKLMELSEKEEPPDVRFTVRFA
ncbi:barstar family protein [Amycolatopsis sp. NPDC048633]|uniref:barstar family protein n=1 Tax=Amycolatopsis sp. NPDC048633 TaxID=3157095 RepID=UPI003400B67F